MYHNDVAYYKEIDMKIKSLVAGLIISTSMLAVVGASQAQPACQYCPVTGFYGMGWHMVPCNTPIQPASTWEQYASGGYAPPVVERSGFIWVIPII